MSKQQYGALAHGHDTGSSVETRILDGARIVVLVAVQGDLATPALESIKGELARNAAPSAAALVAAAPPPPYAAGVAVVLLTADTAHVAASGAARCYRERAGLLEELGAGSHPLAAQDAFVASSHALPTGRAFFGPGTPDAAITEFRNDTLDAALEAALGSAPRAVAAARL